MKTFMRAWVCDGGLALALLAIGAFADAANLEQDRPLRIIEQPRLEFPRKLIRSSITHGEVRLYLDVGPDGRLDDHLIVAYTHFEFANAVSKTVGRWRFEPAMVQGRALASTIAINLRFESHGVMVTERTNAEEPPSALSAFTFRARAINELDRVPRVLTTFAPPNPAAAGQPAITGQARVNFFIDEEGRVRMPVAVAADDERLGWAAVAAIAKWEFESPQRGGRAVLARASQVFVFTPDE